MSSSLAADLPEFVLSAVGLLMLVGAGEVFRLRFGMEAETSRRIIHVGTGLFCASIPFLFERPAWVYLLAAAFAVINLFGGLRGWFPAMHSVRRRTIGTAAFPLALLVALAATWSVDAHRAWVITPAFLVLALADPAASITGTAAARSGRARRALGEKTVAGSAAFFLFASGVLLIVLFGFREMGMIHATGAGIIAAALALALIAAAVEVLCSGGWDNFFIVLAAVVFLVHFDEHPSARPHMLAATGLGILFCWAAWRVRFLDAGGAVAGGLLAATVVGLGGWAWAVPSFAFFILSSLLSKRTKRSGEHLGYEKGDVRDAGQVYANGGVGWAVLLLYVVWPQPALYWAFLGAFAAATADTWATEIGGLSRARPRLITNFRKMEPGTSGAVSAWGLIGGLAGALVIWLVALATPGVPEPGVHVLPAFLGVIGGGFTGSLVDSLIGATFQVQYADVRTGLPTERPTTDNAPNRRLRGYFWIKNDLVNLVCTLTGALLAALAYLVAAP